MLMFCVLLFAFISLSTSASIPDGEQERVRRDSRSESTCDEVFRSCRRPDIEQISPYFEDQVFLNFTVKANNNLCQILDEAVTCLETVAASDPMCNGFIEHFFNIGKIETFQRSLCNNQGRQDLDEVRRCLNNPFLQRHYYWKAGQLDGKLKGIWLFISSGRYDVSNEEMWCKEAKLKCSSVQEIIGSLPEKTKEYCGQSASEAVKRVLRRFYDVQFDIYRFMGAHKDDCEYVPAKIFI